MIRNAIWIIFLSTIALVTTALQLDRQARISPEFATYVPGYFRAFSQAHITASALSGSEPVKALSEAQKLIRRRPLPAENLRLLSAAQFKNGQLDQSARTMQVAALRGWRDPIPQQAMMQFALVSGDKAEAAQRFVALMLKPQTSDQDLLEISEAIFGGPPSQAHTTVVSLLTGTQRWHSVFARRGVNTMPADAFVETLDGASDQGVVFDCYQLQLALRAIERRAASESSAKRLENLLGRQCL